MQDEMTLYKTQLIKIQKYLNVGGSFDSLKIETFANKVHMMFRRMYADLEKQRSEN
jgi:hypothetical protein